MTRGPLPIGLRWRCARGKTVQYGFDIRSRWLPKGFDRSWLPLGTTRSEAESKLHRLRSLIDDARHGLPVGEPGKSLDSFGSVGKLYLDELRNGGATRESVALAAVVLRLAGRPLKGADGHPLSPLTSLPVVAIQPDDVLSFRDVLAASRRSSTTNRYLGVIRSILNYSINVKRLIRWNPANESSVPDVPAEDDDGPRRARLQKVRIFRPSEDSSFLAALPPKYAGAWAISLYCGHHLRRGAICRLRVEDVDLIGRSITVRGSTVKRKARRNRSRRPRRTVVLPIPNRALSYVTELVKAAQALGSEWLLPSENHLGQPLTPRALTIMFKQHVTLAGYPDVRFHHALHNFTTRARGRALAAPPRSGEDLREHEAHALGEAQVARGHDSVTATLIYDHTNEDPESRRRWYDAMDEWHDEQEKLDRNSPKAPPKTDSSGPVN